MFLQFLQALFKGESFFNFQLQTAFVVFIRDKAGADGGSVTRAKRGFIRRRAPAAGIAMIVIAGSGIAAITQHSQGHRFAAAGAEDFFKLHSAGYLL